MTLIYLLIYKIGLLEYSLFKSTNKYSYLAFRKLHGLTNGKINETYSQKVSRKNGKHQFPEVTNGLTGQLNSERLNSITSKIKEQGYYIFDEKLSEDVCENITNYFSKIPSKAIAEDNSKHHLIYDRQNPIAPIYRFDEAEILKNEDLSKIFYDINFVRLSQEYLGSKPLNNSIIMWWSALYTKTASSRAAQLYHFDMDHPKFIKFFIYLTDVDSDSGPHCYVKKSHVSKPDSLIDDKRYSDSDISDNYEASEIVEILGSKGTIVAVDTSGLHKGKLPVNKDRLIVQIEFTNSFFGQKVNDLHVPDLPAVPDSQYQDAYGEVYTRVKTGS
ncbi:MAG: phytanoyl-CoA dioxygenase family protein [Bacteroidota bacterium]